MIWLPLSFGSVIEVKRDRFCEHRDNLQCGDLRQKCLGEVECVYNS